MFNRRRKGSPAVAAGDAEAMEDDRLEETDAPASPEPVAAAEKKPKGSSGGWLGLALPVAIVTVVAAGLGVGLGMQTASSIERAIADRKASAPPTASTPATANYDSDTLIQPVEAVVTNLTDPHDVWVRLETAVVFKKGSIENPGWMAAEVRQDILAYVRTMSLADLDGPSAFQHLREDLNERASVRTDGRVSELIIESLVIQ